MYEIISKGYIAYEFDESTYYLVGEIRKEIDSTLKITYVYDLWEKSIRDLKEQANIGDIDPINGINLDFGYFQRHAKVPFFITMRTPDRRRGDMEEILKRYNLEHYNQFEMLLINRGKSIDKWRVLREELLSRFNILNIKDAVLNEEKIYV